MPIYNYQCVNNVCEAQGATFEKMARMSEVDSEIPCPACGEPLRRVVTGANVVWARPLSFYHNKQLEGASSDHHTAYKKTEKGLVPVRLESVADIRRYCKEENLTDPTDLNPNAMPSSDGGKLATAGVSGQWI